MKRALAIVFAGLLMVSACTSDDSSDSDATTTTTDGEAADTLALDDWVEQADAICEDGNDAGDEIGEVETLDDVVELGPDLLEVAQDQYDALVDLGLPDEQSDDVESALDLLDQQLALLEEIVDAGDDEEAITELVQEGSELEEELDDLAADLGLEVCGAPDEGTSDTNTSDSDSDSSDGDLDTEQGLSELLAVGLGEIGLTADESTCVSDGMVAEYSVTELADLDPEDPAVQSVIVEILFGCVTPERIVELGLQ
jgi:hypothetical protein